MASYRQIISARSDGLLEVATKTGTIEENRPTSAQRDARPSATGVVNCYKRLEPDDPKAIDWRRKLGGMCKDVLGQKEHANEKWILQELPENYVLWEQQKYNVSKPTDKKEKAKHAAGTFERQDAYLYGHPQGRKKRFRSPADFFQHLLWLTIDLEGDPKNCPCKLCSPDGDEYIDEVARPEPVTQETKVVADVPPRKEIKPLPTATRIQTPIPVPQSIVSKVAQQTGPKRSNEQEFDSRPNSIYIYRPGELVWFHKGTAWGLGVISKRGELNGGPRYLLQQLSHPFSHPPYQIKDQHEHLRPWLAWSTPDLNCVAIRGLTYDQVRWHDAIEGKYGPGNVEVDSSILAARTIDSSYSLFDRLDIPAAPGEVHYNGMFLGAEKIWVGEPVRIRVPDEDIVVMIIHKLIEQTAPSTVTFVGDIYKFNEMPMHYNSRAEWPKPNLPARMVSDLRFRNEVADNANRRIWCEWSLTEPAARRSLSDVKGRWYETQALLPILKGDELFRQEISQGIANDISKSMNGRGDGHTAQSFRKATRKDTFGPAVPPDFMISRGLDGPPSDNIFPIVEDQAYVMEQYTNQS
ncbi:transcription-silencing protein clr2 [Phlyctema vagabunda]|uniref:Transcription-silencing protein clr2 n=1 Tax=Phlyctema vagabunda TaxID=108571 RepID=A0ABR4PVI3_9HELO